MCRSAKKGTTEAPKSVRSTSKVIESDVPHRAGGSGSAAAVPFEPPEQRSLPLAYKSAAPEQMRPQRKAAPQTCMADVATNENEKTVSSEYKPAPARRKTRRGRVLQSSSDDDWAAEAESQKADEPGTSRHKQAAGPQEMAGEAEEVTTEDKSSSKGNTRPHERPLAAAAATAVTDNARTVSEHFSASYHRGTLYNLQHGMMCLLKNANFWVGCSQAMLTYHDIEALCGPCTGC